MVIYFSDIVGVHRFLRSLPAWAAKWQSNLRWERHHSHPTQGLAQAMPYSILLPVSHKTEAVMGFVIHLQLICFQSVEATTSQLRVWYGHPGSHRPTHIWRTAPGWSGRLPDSRFDWTWRRSNWNRTLSATTTFWRCATEAWSLHPSSTGSAVTGYSPELSLSQTHFSLGRST